MSQKIDKNILILGVGNILKKDEGVGVHYINLLQQKNMYPHIEIIDGGTSGLDLLYLFENKSLVIIIDAINIADTPGSIYRIDASDLQNSSAIHAHGISVKHLIDTLELLQYRPEIKIIGIIPDDIVSDEIGLSESVLASFSRIDTIIADLIKTVQDSNYQKPRIRESLYGS